MLPRLQIEFSRFDRAIFRKGQSCEPKENELWLNHCRSGLVLALEALQLPKKSKVGVMVYNCHTVMNAVWQAGLTPVFIDITDDLRLDIEDLEKKSNNLRAIIVTHLFGIVNDIQAIKKLYPNLFIIEDCAHIFAHEIEGDFGVYSIGQGKFPSVGDGGVLVVNNNYYLPYLQKRYSSLSAYTSKQEKKLYYKLWLHAVMNKPFTYKHFTLPLKKKRSNKIEPINESIKKMSEGIKRLFSEKQKTYSTDIQLRKQNAQELIKLLQAEDYQIGENAFMLIIHSDSPSNIQQTLFKHGIDSATHFRHCIDWARQFGYLTGSCPNAEKLVKHLIMVPIYKEFK